MGRVCTGSEQILDHGFPGWERMGEGNGKASVLPLRFPTELVAGDLADPGIVSSLARLRGQLRLFKHELGRIFGQIRRISVHRQKPPHLTPQVCPDRFPLRPVQALSQNPMAARQHRIGSDARSDGESWVLMALRAVAPTQVCRFCAAFGGPERAWPLRCRSSLYRLNTASPLRLASTPFPAHREAIGF